jgi:hypothetical protein
VNYDKVRAHKTRLIPATVDVATIRIGKLTIIRLGLIKVATSTVAGIKLVL